MHMVRVSELAKKLGVHRNTIRNWVNSGRLVAGPAPGKGIVISDEEFQRICRVCGVSPVQVRTRKLTGYTPDEENRRNAQFEVRHMGTRTTRLRPDPRWADLCLTCGSCASACPISGMDGLDPRKAVRMVVLGLEDALIESQWPWKCTLCGKCEEACPMNLELVAMLRAVRGLRDRDKVPPPMHSGVLMDLNRGNNLGIPTTDLLSLLRDLGEELAEDECPGFTVPVDKVGANLMVTVNSKEPFGEPDTLKFWWKIFYAAGEDWTIPSEHWEGVNWALFTGDDASMKILVGRLVEKMRELKCSTLLLPD